jgi:hypothetical protein
MPGANAALVPVVDEVGGDECARRDALSLSEGPQPVGDAQLQVCLCCRDAAQSEFAFDLRGVLLTNVELDKPASREIRMMVGGGGHAAEHDAVVARDPLQSRGMREVRADLRTRAKRAWLEFGKARGTASGTGTLGAMKRDLVASALK